MGFIPTYSAVDRLPGYDAWKLASPDEYEESPEDLPHGDTKEHDAHCPRLQAWDDELAPCWCDDDECPGGCGPRCACAYDMRDKMEDER